MDVITQKIKFSPVNIEDRQKMNFNAGDTIRVWQRIKEGNKSRLQAFEGLVIARKHGHEPGATFTMRKVSSGVGVERIFPLYSPTIEKIEIVSHSKVRRAKLYYIREKAAKEVRKKMKKLTRVDEVVMEKKSADTKAVTDKEELTDEVSKEGKKDEKPKVENKEKVEAKEEKKENKKDTEKTINKKEK